MASSLDKIEAEALALPAQERVRLADHLLASVAGGADIDDAWAREVEKRLAEVEAGAPVVPIEAAVERARRAVS
jgi:putative addiction module component (TIGR02574 family)